MSDPVFGEWTRWGARTQIDGRHQGGVYLLGRFDNNPPATVEPLTEATILIAETHAQTLEARWAQFQYCAFQCGVGHSPGITFNQHFLGGKQGDVPDWLYVAAMPIAADEVTKAPQIKRDLLREYGARFGRPPICNTRPG